MKMRSINYLFALLVAMQWSCTEKPKDKTIVLSSDYQKIQDIVSVAHCSSPFGQYITEVHSLADGSCYFKQLFSDSDSPFIVKLDSLNNGYLVTENDSVVTTLSPEDVEMIRGHEFHKMSMDPWQFYTNIHFDKNVTHLGADHERYLAMDRLDNPAKLLYNREEKLISKIELINPKDTSQTIEIHYDKWVDSTYGKMAREIYIVQAKKDTFFFDFRSLKIKDGTGYTQVI